VIADRAAVHDLAPDVVAGDVDDPQVDLAVVDEQPIAWPDVGRQAAVGRGDPVMVAGALRGGDHDLLAVRPDHRSFGELPKPDLRALEVGEHADRAAAVRGDLTDQAVHH
jgi:hypothetical protein